MHQRDCPDGLPSRLYTWIVSNRSLIRKWKCNVRGQRLVADLLNRSREKYSHGNSVEQYGDFFVHISIVFMYNKTHFI